MDTRTTEDLGVPHELAVAVGDLRDALDAKPRRWSVTIATAIQRFLHEIDQHPAWTAELERRALLVATLCGKGSGYAQAASMATAAKHWQTSIDPYLQRVASPIRAFRGAPLSVSEVNRISTSIDAVLSVADVNPDFWIEKADACYLTKGSGWIIHLLDEKCCTTLSDWRHACQAVVNEAARYEADGCRWLWIFRDSMQREAPSSVLNFRAVLKSKAGTTALRPIRRAVDSLVAWIKGHDSLGEPQGSKRYSPQLVPAEFRQDEKLDGEPLTTAYVEEHWSIASHELTRNYHENGAKILTRRIKVGRSFAYAFRELIALDHSIAKRGNKGH
jgi:hypothetical protein